MRRYAFITLAAILLAGVGLFYYSYHTREATNDRKQSSVTQATEKDTREIVWQQLSAQQKEEVNGTWSDGKVSKITLSESAAMNMNGDKSYVGKEVYLVSFPSKLQAVLGDVIIYADVNTADIIGYAFRD